MLRVQGIGAVSNLLRVLRLLVRGKINPVKTLLRRTTAASAAARRLLVGDKGRA